MIRLRVVAGWVGGALGPGAGRALGALDDAHATDVAHESVPEEVALGHEVTRDEEDRLENAEDTFKN